MKLHNIAHWPTERISQRVLYLLIALTVMVFALFYFVAYDRPFADDPSFNAPLFTDLLLVFMLLLVVLYRRGLWCEVCVVCVEREAEWRIMCLLCASHVA